MPDLLTGLLAAIPDEASLANIAGSFNNRADMLAANGGNDAKAWSNVYRVLALSAESAALQRRTGISI